MESYSQWLLRFHLSKMEVPWNKLYMYHQIRHGLSFYSFKFKSSIILPQLTISLDNSCHLSYRKGGKEQLIKKEFVFPLLHSWLGHLEIERNKDNQITASVLSGQRLTVLPSSFLLLNTFLQDFDKKLIHDHLSQPKFRQRVFEHKLVRLSLQLHWLLHWIWVDRRTSLRQASSDKTFLRVGRLVLVAEVMATATARFTLAHPLITSWPGDRFWRSKPAVF